MTAIVSQPIRVPIGGSRGGFQNPFEIIDQYDDFPSEYTGRGRDPSPKRTALSLPASPSSPSSPTLSKRIVAHHHHLPPVTEFIPDDPILYLPPLLSPLPTEAANVLHDRQRGRVEEVLSNFNTRLPHIDPASLVLHQALHHFSPVDEKYAKRRYDTAFNWEELVSCRVSSIRVLGS